MTMTKNQNEAKKSITCWLLGNQPEFILSGISG